MRFIDWDLLIGAFDDAEAAPDLAEGEVAAAIVNAAGLPIRISVANADQVGRRLYRTARLERRRSGAGVDLAGLNKLNLASAPIAVARGDAIYEVTPIAAGELGTETDIRTFINREFAQPGLVLAESAESKRLVATISTAFGAVDDSDAFVRRAPHDLDLVFASQDHGALHLNMMLGEGFLEDAAVYDFCGDLVSADFYDPHYRSTANYTVEQARRHGRSTAYKLNFVHQWNCEHGRHYWRLRATVLGNRLVFRLPLVSTDPARIDAVREVEAVERAISRRFHYRTRVFEPIGGFGFSTLVNESFSLVHLRDALFG